ncbi:MAG: zinc ribbon domain-containing protein [Sphingobacteriales bacterium]|nr:MAG: zinc ribbon domain-containing protein [Sphingobacteriales bacterium]
MEINQELICSNCSKPLPASGFFCGACLTQFKCKECEYFLEKDYVGCINCGTPKEVRAETNTASAQNVNTFRLHETATDRTIEATFSNDVAKDLAGTLRDAAAAGRMKAIASNIPPSSNFNGTNEETAEFAEAEVLNNENGIPQTEAIHKPVSTTNTAKPVEYPTLKAVAMKNLPGTETEWIVVYAFYSSNYGQEEFTRQNIIDKYSESNRKNKSRIKSLTAYITAAVKGGYINPLENSFSVLDKGVEKAKEIISRTNSSSPKAKSSSKTKIGNSETTDLSGNKSKKISNGVKSHKRLTGINFYPSGQKSLVDFIKDYKIKNDNEKNLLFTHYLSEVLKITSVTLDHLYTCYDEVNHKIPENMTKSFSNTKTRTGWLETNNSNIEITTKGINKIKFWNKKD